jgi:hypothetical protein
MIVHRTGIENVNLYPQGLRMDLDKERRKRMEVMRENYKEREAQWIEAQTNKLDALMQQLGALAEQVGTGAGQGPWDGPQASAVCFSARQDCRLPLVVCLPVKYTQHMHSKKVQAQKKGTARFTSYYRASSAWCL